MFFLFFFSATSEILLWCWGKQARNQEAKEDSQVPFRQLLSSEEAQIHVELRKGMQGVQQSAVSWHCPSDLWFWRY